MSTCVICQNKKFRNISKNIRDSKKHKVKMCMKCGHHQLFPMPSELEDKEFYDENKQSKNIQINFKIPLLRERSKEDTYRRIEFVKKVVSKNSKILDIGSGYGFFIGGMFKEKFDVTGIEVSKERRKISKKISNAPVINVNLNNSTDIEKYDFVVIFHVLEHLVNPVDFLKKVKKIMKPKGKILIEVPNLKDFQLCQNKFYRNWYWQRAHLHYFSPKALKKILTKSGFKKIKIQGIQRYGIENMFNWKINGVPQTEIPSFSIEEEYRWIEEFYKKTLEKELTSDTIIAFGQSKNM